MENIPGMLIAAPTSGSGKTVAVCGLLGAFKGKDTGLQRLSAGRITLIRCFTGKCLGWKAEIWMDFFRTGFPWKRT